MLDPELAEERQNEILARARELIEKRGGSWVGHEPWGRRKLAYEIDHKGEATLPRVPVRRGPETLDELTRVLKITDGALRHMAVRRAGRQAARRGGCHPDRVASNRVSERRRRNGWRHQSRRPRREPDQGSRAAPHPERHGGLQAPPGREHAPEGQVWQWGDKPNYFDVTVWGNQAESCAQYLAKGRPVGVDGRLDWREWDAQDGTKRSGGRDHRRQRPVPRQPRRRRGRQSQYVPRPTCGRPVRLRAAPARGRRRHSVLEGERHECHQGKQQTGREAASAHRAGGRRKSCYFCKEKIEEVDYKNYNQLRRYISEKGKIRSRRITAPAADTRSRSRSP